MKPIFPTLAFVLLVGTGSPAAAQDEGTTRPLLTPDVMRRAVSDVPVPVPSQLDPRTDWSRVQRLAASTEIVVSARGVTAGKCRFVSADDATLTVVDLEDVNRATRRIPRDDVNEIRRWTGRRGSLAGAAIGAGSGFLLGYVSAINLAYRDCGGGCVDEGFLIGLSIVGMPIVGGLVGYRLTGDRRTLTTIYVKP